MQNSLTIVSQPHWPPVNDTTEQAKTIISKLPEDEKVQIAVQRLLVGYTLYFTTGHVHSHSPFHNNIRGRVVALLKEHGYQVEEEKDLDDGSSAYGKEIRGWLDGVKVKIKPLIKPMES